MCGEGMLGEVAVQQSLEDLRAQAISLASSLRGGPVWRGLSAVRALTLAVTNQSGGVVKFQLFGCANLHVQIWLYQRVYGRALCF